MSTSQLNLLTRFRLYQRLLIFGSGAFATLMLFIILFTNIKMAFYNQTEILRQSFISEHAFLEKEIADKKNAFESMLKGIYIMLTEHNTLHYTQENSRSDGKNTFIYNNSKDKKLFFLHEDLINNESETNMFLNLADWIERFIVHDDTIKKYNVLSGYIYNPNQGVIDVIKKTNSNSNSDEKYKNAMSKLMEELNNIDNELNKFNHKVLSEGILWLPSQGTELSKGQALRIAAPVMMNTNSFATLVMAFPSPALSLPFVNNDLAEGLSIRAQNGASIAGNNEALSSQTAIDVIKQAARPQWKNERIEQYFSGGIIFLETLGDSGLSLLFQCSWFKIASIVGRQVLATTLATSGLLILIWWFLLYFKLRIFRPIINHSRQVYESEQLSKTLIDTAPVGLGILSLEKQEFLLCSPLMLRTDTRHKVGDSPLAHRLVRSYILHSEAADTMIRPVEFELKLDTYDDNYIHFSVSMAPARYQGDDVLVVAFTDTTNNKRIESQLMAARELADKASAAKSAFLAAMSHEIRTPLNAILGNLELMSHSVPDSQQGRFDIIQRASDNLLLTISDILDFSKIEAGELRLEEIEFDLFSVTEDILAIFSPLAHAKGLLLSGETGNTPTQPMRGDPISLRQILNNLLSNALKFTEKGDIRLRIYVDPVKEQVNIDVEDSGIGMTPAQLKHVFDAFRQADETINRRYGGTGLGLALCTGLVKAMSGQLSVRSQVGKGSTFRLSLPLGKGMVCPELPQFNYEQITLLSSEIQDRVWLTTVLQLWGLRVSSFQHPSQFSPSSKQLNTLIIWGDKSTWHPKDEKCAIAQANNVIDCGYGNSTIPIRNGKVITTSVGSLGGLFTALSFFLKNKPLHGRNSIQTKLSSQLRVLVVEDNPANRLLLKEQLQLLGCEASLAREGEEALRILQHEMFDVVLTDLSMPGMDGYTFGARVQNLWPELPVVAVTANLTLQEYEKCSAVGMCRVLSKPLLLKDLGKVLFEVCNQGNPSISLEGLTKALISASPGMLADKPLPEEIQELFEKSCTTSVSLIRDAISTQNPTVILQELHSLKGAFGIFGLDDLKAQTASISEQIKQFGVVYCHHQLAMFCEELEMYSLEVTNKLHKQV